MKMNIFQYMQWRVRARGWMMRANVCQLVLMPATGWYFVTGEFYKFAIVVGVKVALAVYHVEVEKALGRQL